MRGTMKTFSKKLLSHENHISVILWIWIFLWKKKKRKNPSPHTFYKFNVHSYHGDVILLYIPYYTLCSYYISMLLYTYKMFYWRRSIKKEKKDSFVKPWTSIKLKTENFARLSTNFLLQKLLIHVFGAWYRWLGLPWSLIHSLY